MATKPSKNKQPHFASSEVIITSSDIKVPHTLGLLKELVPGTG
jgi:hypothetical protein